MRACVNVKMCIDYLCFSGKKSLEGVGYESLVCGPKSAKCGFLKLTRFIKFICESLVDKLRKRQMWQQEADGMHTDRF